MLSFMTDTEDKKVFEITNRLRSISSPVLRLQAILQYSQIVDILTLGDTSHEKISGLVQENDQLQEEKDRLCSQLSELGKTERSTT